MVLIGPDVEKINSIKSALGGEFDMKDLGMAKRILGIEIVRDRSNSMLFLHQTTYVLKILKDLACMIVNQYYYL